jgi:tetratricopeptide (TPR) repeat protein
MPSLYFSLCSNDSKSLAHRIVDQCESFMEEKCFLETGDGPFAQEKIRDHLGSCDALIVIINEDAIPLMDSPLQDKENLLMERIRYEIVTAINLNLMIVPLLLDDAVLPEKWNSLGALKWLSENKLYRLPRDFCFEDLHHLLEDIEGEMDFKKEVEIKLSEPFQFNFIGRSETTGNLSEVHESKLESYGPAGFDRVIDSENLILADAQRKGDRAGEKNALSALGLTYARLGQTQKAIQYFEKQLEIVRELADEEEECGLLANLGDAFAISGNIEQAKVYYQEQLLLAESRGYRVFVGSAYNGLGFVYVKQNKISQGIECYVKSLAIYKEFENHDKELELLVGIGLNFRKLGELNRTLEFFELALKVSRYLENRREEARILVDLGDVCYHLGSHERAELYLTRANDFLTTMKGPWVELLWKRLKMIRESLNRRE